MLRYLVSFFLLVVLVSCSKKEESTSASSTVSSETVVATPALAPAPVSTPATAPASVPVPAAPAGAATGIASSDGETAGSTVTIKELKRQSGGTVSLKFVVTNGSDKPIGTGYSFGDADYSGVDYDSVGGVQLIDPVGKKKYFVARDSGRKCVCSQGLKEIKPGSSTNAWAKFPAPPDDVQKISVIIPHFGPMDDVPISR